MSGEFLLLGSSLGDVAVPFGTELRVPLIVLQVAVMAVGIGWLNYGNQGANSS